MSERGWYQEGTVVDHFRGGSSTDLDTSSVGGFLSTAVPALATHLREQAVKAAVKRGEGVKDSLGDIKGGTSILFGITDKEREAGQEVVRQTALKNDYRDSADLYDYSLKNKDGSYKSDKEVKSFLAEREKVKDLVAASGYDATDLNIDLKTVSLENAGSAIRRVRSAEQAKLRQPEQKLAEGKLNLARTEAANLKIQRENDLEYRKWQTAEQNRLNRYLRERQDAESAKDRSDRMDLALLQFQGNQAERQYRREADERRERREDRKDRQMMIMQMMKGLSQLGQAFAL